VERHPDFGDMMTRRAFWGVTITRRDGTTLRYNEERDAPPKLDEIFKMTDADGKTLDLRVESFSRDAVTMLGPESYRVRAKEI
jgi:hypothetical protein